MTKVNGAKMTNTYRPVSLCRTIKSCMSNTPLGGQFEELVSSCTLDHTEGERGEAKDQPIAQYTICIGAVDVFYGR
jgi:hypothetical protein